MAWLLAVAAITGWAPGVLAQGTDTLRVSGFGTLGLSDVSAPHGWGYRRDLSQSGNSDSTRADVDSRIGLQLNYTPISQMELVGQLMAARSSPGATWGDNVQWAFAAVHPTPQVTVRLGRVNLDAFLMSDHRNVGFAYLQARPPVEFYGLLPASLDGGDVAHWVDLGDARWRFKLFAGRGEGGDHGNGAGVRLDPAIGASIARESSGLLVRVGVTRARIGEAPAVMRPLIAGLSALSTLPIPSVAAEAQALRVPLDPAGTSATYMAIGARYESGPWLWSAELAKVKGHTFVNLLGGYVSAGRRFGEWTAYSTYGQVRSSAPTMEAPNWSASLAFDPTLAAQAQALGVAAARAINQGRPKQRTLSLGARWDFHPQMSLKLQLDHIDTEVNGASLWTHTTLDGGLSRVTSVLLDFVF